MELFPFSLHPYTYPCDRPYEEVLFMKEIYYPRYSAGLFLHPRSVGRLDEQG